ncbi:unnamed protein product [Polarella glacialis]|uniref:tRNA pseudouridine synthase n=1 Tax=Polarella glacialis TaxID=89957 RepID=A0A813IQG3_POLGL|nr:unnamed protein product [Polarella glacialis]
MSRPLALSSLPVPWRFRCQGQRWQSLMHDQRRRYSPACTLPLEEAGIKEFLAPGLLGFPAILKQALQDFQVHEIEPQGQELHLSELLGPPEVSFASDAPAEPTKRMEGGWHLHFRLYKEGLDTMDAIARMARCLGRSRRGFRFAGTKDRNAVSVQRVSCSQLEPEALRAAVLHPEWDHRIRF